MAVIKNKNIGIIFLISLLAACAGPVVQDDLPPVEEPGEEIEGVEPPDQTQQVPTEEPVGTVQPSTSNAVQSLTNQARAQYLAHDYQGAIATAERGLRIDRRSPDLYLVLAQSYVQLAMPQRAEQFAQQGLRYSQAGSQVAEALQRVREILSAGGL